MDQQTDSKLDIYTIIYEADDEKDDTVVLSVAHNTKFANTLIKGLIRLIAFEEVEHSEEHQDQFSKIMGKQLERPEVERLVLGDLMADLADGLVFKKEGASYEVQGFGAEFAPMLTAPFYQKDETPQQIETLFKELDSIAAKNIELVRPKVHERLIAAYRFINGTIPFRLSAMLIQLFSEAMLATFSKPSAKTLSEIEAALSASIKLVLEIGRSGRPPGGRRFTKETFFNQAVAAYRRLFEDLGEHPTQYDIASELGISRSRFNDYMTEYETSWDEVRSTGLKELS